MLRRALIAMVLLAVPTMAFAQGGGQRGGQRGGGMGARSPLAIVIEKKADLKLNDEQVVKITALDKALTEKNAPHMAKMTAMREGGQPNREAMMEIQQAIRANNTAAQESLKDVLNAEQMEMATKMIAEATPRGRRGGGV
jgi:hypothetical protein